MIPFQPLPNGKFAIHGRPVIFDLRADNPYFLASGYPIGNLLRPISVDAKVTRLLDKLRPILRAHHEDSRRGVRLSAELRERYNQIHDESPRQLERILTGQEKSPVDLS